MEHDAILAGILLSRQGAQITWYCGKLSQPQTLSLPGEMKNGLMEIPEEVLCQIRIKPGDGGGSPSQGVVRSGDGSEDPDLSGGKTQGTDQGDRQLSPAADYLKKLLGMVPHVRGSGMDLVRVCVTIPSLDEQKAKNLTSAFLEIGIPERQIYLQDFRTSFFYYVVNKKKELWNGDVAFLTMTDERMKGCILHFDRSVTPWMATLHEEVSSDVSDKARAGRSDEDWDRERDRLLYELLGKLFERRNVTASYLYGNYFDAGWAKKSFQYLTFHRHAFQGQNLFSKGACYGAMSRCGVIRMPDIVFLGMDMVRENIGLTVRVRGKQQYLPLVRAGESWYEAHGECEVIPEGEKCITILSGSSGKQEQVGHVIRLDHFPQRPDRATRLRVNVWFSAPDTLETEVTDLGFGSMYPSSGRSWRRSIRLN